MLLPSSVKIYMAKEPMDMRRGIDSLAFIVREKWNLDPYTGYLFLFLSKSRTRAKILYWDNGGFVLFYKRLSKGRFKFPRIELNDEKVMIDFTELSMLLDGIDITKVRRPRKWRPKRKKEIKNLK